MGPGQGSFFFLSSLPSPTLRGGAGAGAIFPSAASRNKKPGRPESGEGPIRGERGGVGGGPPETESVTDPPDSRGGARSAPPRAKRPSRRASPLPASPHPLPLREPASCLPAAFCVRFAWEGGSSLRAPPPQCSASAPWLMSLYVSSRPPSSECCRGEGRRALVRFAQEPKPGPCAPALVLSERGYW